MKNIFLLVALFIFISSCSTVKHVGPKNPDDKKCIVGAKALRNACVAEREPEIQQCINNNKEKKRISQDKFQKSNPKASTNDNILFGLVNSLDVEKCSNYRLHCDREYNERFQLCGGKIITN